MITAIIAAEAVTYNLPDNETGKRKDVVSCRFCYAQYDGKKCVRLDAEKCTEEFRQWAVQHIGEKFNAGEFAYNRNGKVVMLLCDQ